MTQTVKSWGQAITDSMNPFMRLVYQVTADDEEPSVPYYQVEKVKEAALQSEYGCECVHKALMQCLDSKAAVTQQKSLQLIRALLLEGPSGFGAKISSNLGRFITLAQAQDIKKDSVEMGVKQLAQAIQDACQGKPGALSRPMGGSGLGDGGAPAATGSSARAKSEFQEQQEREARAFRKRQEQERKSREVIVLEKGFEVYDHTLPAAKLVAAAVHTQKKKVAPEEMHNFLIAITKHVRPSEVITALDTLVRDAKEGVANRFKAVQLVEHVVLTKPYDEAISFWKAKPQGLQRALHLADTSVKGQQILATLQQLLSHLQTCAVPPPLKLDSNGAEAAPMPTTTKAESESSISSVPSTRTSGPPQQQWGSVAPAPAAVPTAQRPQAVVGASNINAAFGAFDAGSFGAQPTAAGGFGVANTAAAPTGAMRTQQPQQQQQQWGSFGSAPSTTTTTTTTTQQPPPPMNAMWGGVAASSAASPPQQQQQQYGQPAPPQQQLQATNSSNEQEEKLRQMQLMVQRNMEMMMAFQQQQQQQQQSAPVAQPPQQEAVVQPPSVVVPPPASTAQEVAAAPTAWGTTATAPPPIPEEAPSVTSSTANDSVPPSAPETHDDSAPPQPTQTNRKEVEPDTADRGLEDSRRGASPPALVPHHDGIPTPSNGASAVHTPSPFNAPQQQHQPPAPPPTALPAASSGLVTLETLQKLQQQMQQTQAMLMQQQQLYAQLQAKFLAQQQQQLASVAGTGMVMQHQQQQAYN